MSSLHLKVSGQDVKEVQCGSSLQTLQMASGTCSDGGDECIREYHLYLPKVVCSSAIDGNENTVANIGTLPLVFAIHGFTGNPSAMIPWDEMAETFHFIVVRPYGYEKSWNAKYCCGLALENDIDDIGFLTQVIDTLHLSFDFVHRDLVYGTGHSNGGFMVTRAARLFRAVAPISGYQYHPLEDIVFHDVNGNSNATQEAPLLTSIFQHHSIDDGVVLFEGCCAQSKYQCCCNISADKCISSPNNNIQWGKDINQCDGEPFISYQDDRKGITCYVTSSCLANTTLCVYQHSAHFSMLSKTFPMFEEVGHFFASDACSLNGGQWERATKMCSCDSNGGGINTVTNTGKEYYCLDVSSDDRSLLLTRQPGQANLYQQQHQQQEKVETLDQMGIVDGTNNDGLTGRGIVLFGILSCCIGLGFILYYVQTKKQKRRVLKDSDHDMITNASKWQRVPTVEPTSSHVELAAKSV